MSPLPKSATMVEIIRAMIRDLEKNGRQRGRNQNIEETSRSLRGAAAHATGHLVTMHNMSAQAREAADRVASHIGIDDLDAYNDDHTDEEVLNHLRKFA